MQVEFGTDVVSQGEQFIWPSKRDWGARYNSILIYDDDDISVVFFSGNSDFLLITFGDLVNLAEGNRFYAEQPVKKAGFNCLGFMAKTANWFPAASVVAACERTAAIIAHFDHRVTYGGSMGGYAAIKFSALFEADLVIAFCPQWTLDGDECDGTNPGWSTYFQPRMKGMSIKSSDMAGKLYCFVDMQDPTDRFHIQKIAAIADKPTIVNVPMCSHHVTAVLAGTENLQSIISLCRSHSVDDLIYTIAKIRRKSILRKIIVMQRLFYKSPRTAINILYAHKGDLDFNIIASQLILEIVKREEFLVNQIESSAMLDRVQDMVPPDVRHRVLLLKCKLFGKSMCIRSFRHHVLVYDVYLDFCVHVDPIGYSTNNHRYILISHRQTGSRITLYIKSSNIEAELAPDIRDGKLRPVSSDDPCEHIWTLETVRPCVFALRAGAFYLSAQFDGEITVDRPTISDWELLSLSTI